LNKQVKHISLTPKQAHEAVAQLLTINTEFLELLKDYNRVLENALTETRETAVQVAADIMSLQKRFFDIGERLDEFIRE
jgi:hypothetical protein